MQVKCQCGCGAMFEAQRRDARFASATCRKRASRAPKVPAARGKRPARKAPTVRQPVMAEPPQAVPEVPPEPPRAPAESVFEVATREQLEQLGQADSMLGQQVLIIARRMAGGTETGSALATLSKEHSRLMTTLGGAERPADPVDEVSRRREEKLARATAG